MNFPEHKYGLASSYARAYAAEVAKAHASVDLDQLDRAAKLLEETYAKGRWVFVCGNGGSAAIANHLVCDHCKGIQADTPLRPKVSSLSCNLEIITAIANDVDYSEVFVHQLRTLAGAGDVLLTISASGDSPNVVKAQQWAKENGVSTIAMTGFSGGRTNAGAGIRLHVDAHNYGVVEDVHQSLMHILAQHLRLTHMPHDLVGQKRF